MWYDPIAGRMNPIHGNMNGVWHACYHRRSAGAGEAVPALHLHFECTAAWRGATAA